MTIEPDKTPIEPTEEQRRNGWTTEALARYFAESEKITQNIIDPAGVGRRSQPKRCLSPLAYSRWRVR